MRVRVMYMSVCMYVRMLLFLFISHTISAQNLWNFYELVIYYHLVCYERLVLFCFVRVCFRWASATNTLLKCDDNNAIDFVDACATGSVRGGHFTS